MLKKIGAKNAVRIRSPKETICGCVRCRMKCLDMFECHWSVGPEGLTNN